jgi:sugar phosphate isomerase/epimerase
MNTISRRKFIVQSGALMSASLFAMETSAAAKKYKMGLQLFTIRADLAKDLKGTLQKVKTIGYEDSETYGFNGDQGTYYGQKSADFKKLLEDNSLITTSGHYDFHPFMTRSNDDLARYTDQCIEGAHALGQKYITWPWIDPQSRTIEKFQVLAEKLNFVGERVTKSGLGFAYHNHDYEFKEQDGKTGYDIVMKNTDAKLVKLQMDLYWVMRDSKRSPAELIALQPGRFVMWHIKDMDKNNRDYSELGNGSIDFTPILPLASKAGMEYYYIEQGGNFQHNPIQSITDSAAYFKKNLEKHIG